MKQVYFKHPDKHGPLLEGVLHLPEAAAPRGGAVVCHPHPEYGGSMDVPLVVAIAKGLARAGWAALRFNFRGVGQSQGAYDEGRGEVEDVEAAAAYIRGHDAVRDGPLALVGYSFGAWVALEAAQRTGPVTAVAAVALPLWRMPEGWLHDLDVPKLFVAGDRDTVCPVAELKAWAGGLSGLTEIAILTRADHYLAGREGQVADEVARFLNAHAEPPREGAK
ncbi:MAG: Dot/Icm type IV secretion system effector CoxH3 [Anaerolineales bacterium]